MSTKTGQGQVDTLTSNVGHLIGTGILSEEEEKAVAALLVGPAMSSGFGIRTLSTGARGYWPLSYHVGSVWPHDTAVTVRGMQKAGLREEAASAAAQLVRAASGFDYVIPELYSGDSAGFTARATPYPASCRPQAWSAAAFVCAAALA